MLKLRIVVMVLVTASMGMLLGGGSLITSTSACALIGTALMAGGACALNHYLERDADGLMVRTRGRPLPRGRIRALNSVLFGIVLTTAGAVLLVSKVNVLAATLGLVAVGVYVLLYTPMKRVSWVCTPIGAVAGAIPPLIGWASVTARLESGAWLLFVMLFLWQHVHFYAIAWILREDYARGGFRMLPVVDNKGTSALRQIVIAVVGLLVVSLMLDSLGLAGPALRWGSLFGGGGLLACSIGLSLFPSMRAARVVALSSICYLPLMLALILFDR